MFDEAGGETCPVSGPRYSACGRKDGGGGLLESPESLQPQLGWFEGERGALSFHPGWEEKKDSFAPQVLPNLPLFLYNSAKPLADTIFVADRNGAGPHLERNTAAGVASMCLALAQGCNQAGKGLALHGCTFPPTQIGSRSWCAANWLGPD